MDTYSEDFKAWMDTQNLTAETLAPIIGKSAGTIANWRSIGVPERQSVRRFLTEFMVNYRPAIPQATSDVSDYTLRIDFTDEQMALVNKAADIVESTPREFIRRATIQQARMEVEKQGKSNGTDG